jgi:hypothetical protein
MPAIQLLLDFGILYRTSPDHALMVPDTVLSVLGFTEGHITIYTPPSAQPADPQDEDCGMSFWCGEEAQE